MTTSQYDISLPIKKVIDGKVYSTIGAMLIHELLKEDVQPFGQTEATQLYKNRLGKWFFVVRNELFHNLINDETDLRDRVQPCKQEDAFKWMEQHCPQRILELLEVPEASDPSATISLRVPREMKIKMTTLAIEEGLSLNGWCIETLKRGLVA
jgi:predicted HicB family RNase H-like nuclease